MGLINSVGQYFEKLVDGFRIGVQAFKVTVKGNLEFQSNGNTAEHIFPDRNGTVALLDDLFVVSQYRFYSDSATLDQDVWIHTSSITKIVKSAGVNTVEYKINAGSFVLVSFTGDTWTGAIAVTANQVLTWRVTFNGGYESGAVIVKHNRV
jgi:hypothetical protein